MTDETNAQLEAEANAALAGAPAELEVLQAGAPAAPPVDHSAEWQQFMGNSVNMIAIVALPQWKLSSDEKNELAQSLAGCLDQLFPDGINGAFIVWARLVMCVGGITVSRVAANGGKLPPFGPKLDDEESETVVATQAQAPPS